MAPDLNNVLHTFTSSDNYTPNVDCYISGGASAPNATGAKLIVTIGDRKWSSTNNAGVVIETFVKANTQITLQEVLAAELLD